MPDSGSDRCVAAAQTPAAGALQAARFGLDAVPSRPTAVDRQLRARIWLRVRVPALLRPVALHHVRPVRAAAKNRARMGVSSLRRRDALLARGAVLRGAGVRMRCVRVLHVSAVRAGHVLVAGRPRPAAGRGMTRGPGAPAAAAPLPASPTLPSPGSSLISPLLSTLDTLTRLPFSVGEVAENGGALLRTHCPRVKTRQTDASLALIVVAIVK